MSSPTGACTRSNKMGRKAFFGQLAENGDGLALRADHSDVAGLSLHRPAQHAHVVAMAARNDDDVRRFTGASVAPSRFEVFGDYFFGFGKAFAVGVGVAVIDYGHIKASARVAIL